MGAPTTHFQPYAKEHKNTKGPGDARPTAMDIIKAENLVGQLGDKTMIVTGCSSGIGIETARALHATGAKLILTVRNKEKGEAAVQDILKTSQGKGSIELLFMELNSLASVRAAATEFLSRHGKLNVLINNAAVGLFPYEKTVDGFEMHIGTNHFGHFLFFQLLKPILLKSSQPDFPSRVVAVTSSAHRISPVRFHDMHFDKEVYNKWLGYGQSKTANIYFANSIERHYGRQGVHGYAVHPGFITATDSFRHATADDIADVGSMEALKDIEKSISQGAATQVWAAVSKYLEDKGGIYLADVGVSELAPNDEYIGGPGYGAHAYDEEAEEKLWKLSYEAAGMPVED